MFVDQAFKTYFTTVLQGDAFTYLALGAAFDVLKLRCASPAVCGRLQSPSPLLKRNIGDEDGWLLSATTTPLPSPAG